MDTRAIRTIVPSAIIGLLCTVVMFHPTATRANDSTAELSAGGLIFVKNAAIAMRSENLFISQAEVRVRYVFFNESQRDVTNVVAFPMPDITISDMDTNIAFPTDDPENILNFTTIVDGTRAGAQVEQKVYATGIDQTDLLRRLKIPLAPQRPETLTALDQLPSSDRDQFVRLGLAEIDDSTNDTHLVPRWTLKTTYHWQQTFPAGRELVIEHRYKPSVGDSAGTGVITPGALRDYQQKYCIDAAFLSAATQAQQAAQRTAKTLGEKRVNYILTTGGNWSAPIGDFKLVIDKGKPNNLVSFCLGGVKKISPTQFEVHKTNFVPQSDLKILILELL